MPTGVIGQPYIFQVLFVDEQNLPVAAEGVVITVSKFDSSGAKENLVADVDMSAVAGDTGRFVYVLLDTSALDPGDVIYGLSTGTNPDTDARMLVETDVSMVVSPSSGAGTMVARFVRGG